LMALVPISRPIASILGFTSFLNISCIGPPGVVLPFLDGLAD
jgi:hypothetical protein